MKHIAFLTVVFLSSALSGAQAANEPSPVEARLREGLRAVTLQLREAQTQVATLQAAQGELEEKNRQLTLQKEDQAARLIQDKEVSERSVANLNARIEAQNKEFTKLNQALAKWKQAYEKLLVNARTTEAKRAELAERNVLLDRQVADQKSKNQAMYELGNEVLTRYQKFGLGDALLAREPFVGVTRVKFQNLIQEYSDKLTDQKIKP